MHPTPIPQALLCLASISPRRHKLLTQLGVPHTVRAADIDERSGDGELPRRYVARMAREKALEIVRRGEELPVLAADTTVVLGGEIFAKPVDRADGLAMLGRLSGRSHVVLTAVALAQAGHPRRIQVRLSVSTVAFRVISPGEACAYWETGEPCDKAGSYGIQGFGAAFIRRIHGSHSGVMGLPIAQTADLLRRAGIPVWMHAGGGPSGPREGSP
jgi:septum formation protein